MVILAIGIAVAVRSFPTGAPGTPGPAVFPLALAVLGAVLGAALWWSSWSNRKPSVAPKADEPTERKAGWTRTGIVVMTAIYVILMPHVGFVSSSAVLVASVMGLFGYRHKARALALGLVVAFIIHGVFSGLMHVPLPRGFLG